MLWTQIDACCLYQFTFNVKFAVMSEGTDFEWITFGQACLCPGLVGLRWVEGQF